LTAWRARLGVLAALCLADVAWAAPAVVELPLRWSSNLSAASLERAQARSALATPPSVATAQLGASSWPRLLSSAEDLAAANRAADAGVLAAQGLSQQAWASAWMPRLDASAATSRRHQQVKGINDTTVDTPTTSMSLSATLPVWRAADRASARSQSALADQARWQARQSRTGIGKDLSVAYLSAIEAAENRRLTLAQQALLQEQLRINERRLQAGAGTVLDVLETRTRIDQARAAVQDLNTRLASQRLTLERLGHPAVVLPAGFNEGTPAMPDVVPPLDDALQLAASRNPAIQDAQALIASANAVDQARSAEFWQPTVDAVASASRAREVPLQDGVRQSLTSTERAVGLQMNWALFTGGLQQGRTREAAALLVQAQARRDDAQAQVEAILRDAYQSLSQARQVISVQRQVEQTATATFEAIRKAFVAGMRTNLDLLNAQQQIYAARQSVVSARIAAINAQVTILATLDLLDADHIAPFMPIVDTAPLPTQPEPAL
jgi:outer membrane protein